MLFRTFRVSILVTILALAGAYLVGGPEVLALVCILAVLEVSLSFDNAVMNATVLGRLSPFWQRLFLTVGVAIAVFGMRLLFPFVLVTVTAGISPAKVVDLAIHQQDLFKQHLLEAHTAIAAFGGIFLLMIFLDFVFEEREIRWLGHVERALARIGKLDQLSVVIAVLVLLGSAQWLTAAPKTVLIAGSLGLVTYLLVNGLGELFEASSDDEAVQELPIPQQRTPEIRRTMLAVGKQAFFLFLYLEVLDASFSFDGVVGAFAITSEPFVIAVGLGIGAMYIRSLTVYLVRKGTLHEYVYLEHGAHWAIGALAAVLLITLKYEISDILTGLIGVGCIAAALLSSVRRNVLQRRAARTRQSTEPSIVDGRY